MGENTQVYEIRVRVWRKKIMRMPACRVEAAIMVQIKSIVPDVKAL